jgi:hypothetical protein
MPTTPDPQTPESQGAEVALPALREWLHVTLSSIGDAVITTDADGIVA